MRLPLFGRSVSANLLRYFNLHCTHVFRVVRVAHTRHSCYRKAVFGCLNCSFLAEVEIRINLSLVIGRGDLLYSHRIVSGQIREINSGLHFVQFCIARYTYSLEKYSYLEIIIYYH